MSEMLAGDSPQDSVHDRYRDNFARHLLGVTLYLQSSIMEALTREHGHTDLRINFEPFINIIGEDGARLSDIAALLAVSRQAANQTANQIEAAGYICRRADPSDGRAKLLVLTARGRTLRRDGAREAMTFQNRIQDIVGDQAIKQGQQTLYRLNAELGLLLPAPQSGIDEHEAWLPGLLPRLRDYVTNRLMYLTANRGHPGLKQSFGQVLTAIGPRGGRIQQMAETHGVSKQAISAVAAELEELGYIHRVPDPVDARQVLLHFTASGRALIGDSVASVDDLYGEFGALVGRRSFDQLCAMLRAVYRAFHLEEDVFGNGGTLDIRVLARQLKQQLGEQGAHALGELLILPGGSRA